MEVDDDAPEDVKKATSVTNAIKKGEKDDTFEGYPRVQKKRRKWEHCEEKKPKTRKSEGNGSCCQGKEEKRKQRARKFTTVTVFAEPCTLPKLEVVPRHCLTKQQHIDLLATPNRKCPPDCKKESVLRRLKPISPRLKELAKPPRQRILIALKEGATRLPAALLDNLVNALEEETCMTPEQAAKLSRKQKVQKTKKKDKKKEVGPTEWGYKEVSKAKKPSATNASTLDRESVICQYLMAERFVKSILKWKCPIPREEFSDIAQVLIRRLAHTLEYTPTEDEDRKSQQMRFLADIVACWIAGVITEVAGDHEKELEERCKKKAEQRKALLMEEDDDDDDYDYDSYDRDGTANIGDYDEEDQDHGVKGSKSRDKTGTQKTGGKGQRGGRQPQDEEETIVVQYQEDPREISNTEGIVNTETRFSIGEEKKLKLASEPKEFEGPHETKVGTGSEATEMGQAMEPFDEQQPAKVGLQLGGTKTEQAEDLAHAEAKVESEASKDTGPIPNQPDERDKSVIPTQQSAQSELTQESPIKQGPTSEPEMKQGQIPELLPNEKAKTDSEIMEARIDKIDTNAEPGMGEKETDQSADETKRLKEALEPEALSPDESAMTGDAGEAKVLEKELGSEEMNLVEDGKKSTEEETPKLESDKLESPKLESPKLEAEQTDALVSVTPVPSREVKDVDPEESVKELLMTSEERKLFTGEPAIEELFKSGLPPLTFKQIVDTVHKMLEDTGENTGKDKAINNIHRVIYETLRAEAMNSSEPFTEEVDRKLDVTCGKIATWLKTVLSEAQIAFMEKYIPEVESKELRDWMSWLCYVTDTASNWNLWLQRVIGETKDMKDSKITRGQWQDWTKRVDKGALLWRLFYLETKNKARQNVNMITGRRVIPTGTVKNRPFENSERLIRATDLHT